MSNENKTAGAIEETDFTKEENKEMLRGYEDDILGGLLAAAGFKDDEEEIHPIEIVREGVTLLKFRVHPLQEEDYHKCKERYTKYVRNKQLGVKFPENTDTSKYRSALIYEATVKEDQERIWNNKDAWKRLDVITGVELIGRVLKAGEKDAVLDKIDEISGYSLTAEEVAKN